MELRESIESINEQLLNKFGRDINSDRPRYRIVFSQDEYEKRITDRTDEGFQLLQPEVRLLPKYKQYIVGKYILEQLVEIPEGSETDQVEKVIYDVIWVFQDKNGNYLPPFFEGCEYVIDAIHQSIGRSGAFAKYKDPNVDPEYRKAELERVERELFGNETEVGDHLAYGTGVVVPGSNSIN